MKALSFYTLLIILVLGSLLFVAYLVIHNNRTRNKDRAIEVIETGLKDTVEYLDVRETNGLTVKFVDKKGRVQSWVVTSDGSYKLFKPLTEVESAAAIIAVAEYLDRYDLGILDTQHVTRAASDKTLVEFPDVRDKSTERWLVSEDGEIFKSMNPQLAQKF